MRILIYGGNGWIGKKISSNLEEMGHSVINSTTRVDDIKNTEQEIKKLTPDRILCIIGRTHGTHNDTYIPTIDYLEKPGKLTENIRDNLFSPLSLALVCKENNIHLTYMGTGCIFTYDDNKSVFTEVDEPNFFGSSYSVVKGFTDRLMHMFSDTVLNVRIRMPISSDNSPRNFINKILKYNKICSMPNSMTVLDELLPIMCQMCIKGEVGTVNLTNPGVIEHKDILDMYKEIVDPSFTYTLFSYEEQAKVIACDRSNNELDTSRLSASYNVLNIKDSVRNVMYKLRDVKPINLLITGGCGFIGSNFINYYFDINKHCNIVNIDALYYCASVNNIKQDIKKSTRYKFYNYNLYNDNLDDILAGNSIDYVIHFAAQSHVDNSFEKSLQYTRDNVLGTHCLVEACRKYGKIKKFIHVSTDEVYGESSSNTFELEKTESSILCPTNPYAATKAAAELIVKSYYHSFGFPVIITRGNNVYGPNQYLEKLIPKFIDLLNNNKKLTIQGDGSNIRSFIHVEDVCEAFKLVLEKGKIGDVYNIGDSNAELSVMDVSKKLISMIKPGEDYSDWIEYIDDRPFNDKRYYISNTKIKQLGWCSKINFDDGVKSLI